MKFIILLMIISQNVYSQAYIGSTIFDEETNPAAVSPKNKANNTISKNIGNNDSISYTPSFKYGQSYINGKKLNYNEFGFLINKNNYVSGISMSNMSSSNFKIQVINFNAGWQFNTDTSFFNKPYIIGNAGLSSTSNQSEKYKGLSIGVDTGIETYRIQNVVVLTGIKINSYSNESEKNPTVTDKKIYVGLGFSF